jgi:signal transduction histidine kinase
MGAWEWVRGHAFAADVALAALLACLAQVEVWTVPDPGTARPVLALVGLAMTVPFVWRRRWPLAVLVAVAAVLTVSTFAWDTAEKAVFPTIAVVLAVYSAAVHCDLRAALFGLAIVMAPVFAHQVGVQHDFADFVFIAVMTGSVWVAGRAVRAHGARAVEAAGGARAAESEADERTSAAIAEERLRIARELHDVVAHSVSVMTVQAAAERRVLHDDAAAKEVLVSIEETGRQAMTEMRRLLGMLRAGHEQLPLSPQPGVEYAEALIEQVEAAGLPVEWRVEGEARPLPSGVDLAAYRIIQESLTNALKHAGPATATVTIRYAASRLEVEIADTGRGANGSRGTGHGLIGMRERVSLYGGEFHCGDGDRGGYVVRAGLPLTSPRR